MTSESAQFWIDVASRGGPLLALAILGYIARAFLRVDVVPKPIYDAAIAERERERGDRVKAEERADKALDVAHLANSALDKMTDVHSRSNHERP